MGGDLGDSKDITARLAAESVKDACAHVRSWLASAPSAGATSKVSDVDLVDAIACLESLKSAAAAAQARASGALLASRLRAGEVDARERAQRRIADMGWDDGQAPTFGVTDRARVTRAVGAEVALARHEDGSSGLRHLRLAQALTSDLPHTLTALTRGHISEERALIVSEGLATLAPAQRGVADDQLSTQLSRLGDRSLRAATLRVASQLDATNPMRRHRAALTGRGSASATRATAWPT